MKRPKAKTLYRVPIAKAKRSIVIDIADISDDVLRAIMKAGRRSLKVLDRWANTQIKREYAARRKWTDEQISMALAYARLIQEKAK